MGFKIDKTNMTNVAYATLTKDGKIRFNTNASRKYSLRDYKSVVCYFDADDNRLGFKRTNSSKEKYRRALTKMAGGPVSVSIKSFLKNRSIPKSKTDEKRYKVYEEHGFLVIDLDKELNNDNRTAKSKDSKTW